MSNETRSIVGRSHSYPIACDALYYVKSQMIPLRDVRTSVERDGNMFKLIFWADLDMLSGKVDIEFTGQVCQLVRAFLVGARALPQHYGDPIGNGIP